MPPPRSPYAGAPPGYPPDEPWQALIPLFPWVVGLLLLLWLGSGAFYTVAPNEQAVLLRFGKVHTTAPPGLHFKIPLVDDVLKVSVEERALRLPFGASARADAAEGGRGTEEPTLMLTGDLNTASVEWTVQWNVADPEQFIRRFPAADGDRQAQDLLATVARTVMNRLVGDYSFDEVISPKRGEIADTARRDTQRVLDSYECGLMVTALQLQRVVPPDEVKPSFDEVNASIQEKQKLENEAEATRNQVLPKARAAADKSIREAEGFAARRTAEASGEIEALLARYRAYRRAPDVTRQRLYLEAMQDVLGAVRDKTILDSDLKQVLPLIDLQGGGAGRATAEGGTR